MKLGLLIGVLFFNLPAFATNYGVVDIQKIILTVDEGIQARKSLETEIKKKEGELQTRKKELDKLMEEVQKQGALLSEEAKVNKQKEFQEKAMSLRNDEVKFQNELKSKEAMATQKIAVKVAKQAEIIALAKGIDLIFEASNAGLVYVKDPIDLTPEIIKALGGEVGKKEAKK